VIKAPFPYFGGKSKIASEVWRRFGQPDHYIEPFCGSAAVLLARPLPISGTETINDINAWVTNAYRAIKADPEQVASYAAWPVNELDLHARGDWLFHRSDVQAWIEQLRADPDYYDAKSAGWWIWGSSAWIGDWQPRTNAIVWRQRPHLTDHGIGIHRKRPHLMHRGKGIHRSRPHLDRQGTGIHFKPKRDNLIDYMHMLANRLRNVRICCGDWQRVCTRAILAGFPRTALFLDPPYSQDLRDPNLYSTHDEHGLAEKVRIWCLQPEHGNLRIALCGYEGEHQMPEDWECLAWKAQGGLANEGQNRNANRFKERIWFSPACLQQRRLF
jgi:site-specific DNA-adenine methylase